MGKCRIFDVQIREEDLPIWLIGIAVFILLAALAFSIVVMVGTHYVVPGVGFYG